MTAIVCQFLWSGIAPSGDDKSQSSGPEYMLKVSCDVLKLSVIYSTTCMLLWWLIITETRDFSLWNFLGKGYMPRKMLVSYMYFWGDKYINVINCNLSAHLVWGLLWANTSLNCHSSKFKILIFCCESHKDLSMSVLIIWWPYISTVLFTWWFSFMFTYHIPEHLIMCIGLVTRT